MCAFTGIFMHISSKNVTLRLWRCIWSAGTWLQCDKPCHWTQSLNGINVTGSLGRGINLRAFFWAEQPLWGFSDLVRAHRCQCQCMSWHWTAPQLQHWCHTSAGAAAGCYVVVGERDLTHIRSFPFSEGNDHTFFTVVNPLFTGSIFNGETFKNVC